MDKTFIDKLAFIYIKDGKVLSSLSRGKDTWYIQGGKREAVESDEQALTREVLEELSVRLDPATIKHYGTFEAQAHGKPEGTVVRMTCYTAEVIGEIKPAAEVEQVRFLGYGEEPKMSPVDHIIFEDLHNKGLIK